MLYLDTSALVKLVTSEKETVVLRDLMTERASATTFSSYLAHTELLRAARRHGAAVTRQARAVLAAIHLVDVTRQVLETAGALDTGAPRRSLDAIHLATGLLTIDRLEAVVTYDRRMRAAAGDLGLVVEAPGSG